MEIKSGQPPISSGATPQTPAESAKSRPLAPGQLVSGQVVSGQVVSGQVVSGQTVSGQIVSGQLGPGKIAPGQIAAGSPDTLLTHISVRGLPPELLRPQVIEAIVLRNTLLPPTQSAPGNPLSPLTAPLLTGAARPLVTATSSGAAVPPQLPNLPLLQINTSAPVNTLYRIALQWQGKTFDVMAQQPLPDKTPLQIQVGSRNELILRNTPLAVKTIASAAMKNLPPTNLLETTPASMASPLSPRERVQQLIQPLVREHLPRQQPLQELLPALRALIKPELLAKLPVPLTRAILHLWQALPTPKQLQQPGLLKQILNNSGHFFEAHTAAARAQSGQHPDAVPRVLVTDLKAQLIVLATLLRSRTNISASQPIDNAETTRPTSGSQPLATSTSATGTREISAAQESIYTKPMHRAEAGNPGPHSSEETLDQLLQTLGKTLEAGLSRIHLNQLDTLLSRHHGNDPAQTIPTWILELPVQTARGREQFNVRIEQHARNQEQKRYKQWLVQLGFDLHEHGKLSATLSIVEHSVAATLWAEQEKTHRTVQREMQSLREGLESVGVKVTEMQCRLGVPPERNTLLSQRLVDIHS